MGGQLCASRHCAGEPHGHAARPFTLWATLSVSAADGGWQRRSEPFSGSRDQWSSELSNANFNPKTSTLGERPCHAKSSSLSQLRLRSQPLPSLPPARLMPAVGGFGGGGFGGGHFGAAASAAAVASAAAFARGGGLGARFNRLTTSLGATSRFNPPAVRILLTIGPLASSSLGCVPWWPLAHP